MIREKVLAKLTIKEDIFPYALKLTSLLGISIAAPFFHFQAVTGTIVNAALILAVVMLGRREAIVVGIFPSIISIVAGLLAPAAQSLIPFIIISNIVLILTFDIFRKKNYWKGIIAGSILKFAFLYFFGMVLVKIFDLNELVKIISVMFSWQQLLTALSGGVVAYVVLKIFKKI